MNPDSIGPLLDPENITSEIRARSQKSYFESAPKEGRKKELLEQDGWQVVRENVKSFRMGKPKAPDEQLEDEIWCLVAKMGFPVLSKGRQFKIKGRAGIPRQIDVFGKDLETAVFIECTAKASPGKKRLTPLLEKIISERREIHRKVQDELSPKIKLKQRFIIATRNIEWSVADLERAKESNIHVWRDQDIDYYKKLSALLSIAVRFQFLGEVFSGEEIRGLDLVVPATKGAIGGKVFYCFLMRPIDLLKISYVSHKAARPDEEINTYQRLLTTTRLKAIAKYINDGGVFPTNIVINIESNGRTPARFDQPVKNNHYGSLHIPPKYCSAWIIDGQHRLYGYAFSDFAEKATVPVLAFYNLPADEQAKMFIDINHEQVRVSKALLIDIFSELHWSSKDGEARLIALSSKLVKNLNNDVVSPLRDRIVITGKRKDHYRCLSLTSLADGIRKQKLLGVAKGEQIFPGPLSDEGMKKTLHRASKIFSGYLKLFGDSLLDQWERGDDKGGYICTNNALNALFRVLRAICDHIDRSPDESLETHELSEEELVNKLATYIKPVIKFLKSATPETIQRYRNQVGIKGQRAQSMGMMSHIRNTFSSFDPPGLQDYLDSHNEESTDEATRIIHATQRRLFDNMINKLKQVYGDDEKGWWRQGVPQKVRVECAQRAETDPQGLEKERQFLLMDYKRIAAANWEVFKDDFQIIQPDKGKRMPGKERQLANMVRLNNIRNTVDHPERGFIDKDQLEFVRQMAAHFERVYPD